MRCHRGAKSERKNKIDEFRHPNSRSTVCSTKLESHKETWERESDATVIVRLISSIICQDWCVHVFVHCLACAHGALFAIATASAKASLATQHTTLLHVHSIQFTVLSAPHSSPFIDTSKQFKSYKLRCTSAILLILSLSLLRCLFGLCQCCGVCVCVYVHEYGAMLPSFNTDGSF